MVCGDESIGLKPQSLHYCQGYKFRGTRERNQWYVLMMKGNKPESAVQDSHLSLLLVLSS